MTTCISSLRHCDPPPRRFIKDKNDANLLHIYDFSLPPPSKNPSINYILTTNITNNMSLPTAQKDIANHPSAGAVTDPVNKANKDADLDRKVRFYGVIEAFRRGRMPDNNQIDSTLKYVLDNSPVDLNSLSPEGRNLIDDTRDIIETARLIAQEKNADELFQNFVWHTRDVNADQAKKDPNEVLPVDKAKAQTDGQQAVKHLRTLLNLVLTNSEARKLLSDFSVMGRDLLARGASKAADTLRPDEERLRRTDEAAPQDQFITEGGRVAGPNETPVLEAGVPGTDHRVAQHPHEPLGSGAKVKTEDGDVMSGDTAYRKARTQAEEHKERGADIAQREKDQLQRDAQEARDRDDVDPEVKKQGVFDRLRGYRDGLSDRIPQEHKDRANEKYDRGREFLTEEYFPEERRDQFIYRGKKVIIECQKHDDYQQSLKWLMNYFEEYVGHARTVAEHGKDSHSKLSSDPALNTAMAELRTLLERFANGTSMNMIFDAFGTLADDTRRDPELRDWFRRVDTYIRKVLFEPGFVLEPACNNEAKDLRESGRRFYDEKYKGHFDNLFNSVGDWFKAMGDDPLNKRFGEDWARLTRDLLFDSEGGLKFKPHLWNDIRKVILPQLIDKVGYMPIPRIEYTDDAFDLVLENLTLSGRNLFPNVVSFETKNYVKFSPYNAIKDEGHHEITLTFGQIQADMRDVAFYFRKKTGMPKLMDTGLADVLLGGEGLTATVHLASADRDRSSVYHVKQVNVKIDTLKFSIRDSRHDALYKIIKPIATGLVKKQIQKVRYAHESYSISLVITSLRRLSLMQSARASSTSTSSSSLSATVCLRRRPLTSYRALKFFKISSNARRTRLRARRTRLKPRLPNAIRSSRSLPRRTILFFPMSAILKVLSTRRQLASTRLDKGTSGDRTLSPLSKHYLLTMIPLHASHAFPCCIFACSLSTEIAFTPPVRS
ncbi:hypothetical protein HGRIS_008869 [Hohenbuehelia grisea]|uniref:Uncharacterized protein n=1 Tax=Hohenbuehelia grisea TaxID=104357 RepID=A0ABR3IZU4_9AGAR